jgi:hypothetical protein
MVIFHSAILFLAFTLGIPVSLPAQTASKKPDLRLNTMELVPEWKLNDDEFKEFLLQVEAVLPVYESSLNDLEGYIGKQQNLPYRAGKVILDDIKEGHSDIDDIRTTIKSLHGKRNTIDEINLAKAMLNAIRDEIDLELNERAIALAEYQLDIHFPIPFGSSGGGKQFFSYYERVENDYMYRVMFLEAQLYISRNSHTH